MEIKELEGILKKQNATASSMLMGQMQDVSITREGSSAHLSKYYMESYKKFTDLIIWLGWEEHTSDWDPFHIITFTDGTTFETGYGHWEIEIKEENVRFEYVSGIDKETGDEITGHKTFKIIDIAKISLKG